MRDNAERRRGAIRTALFLLVIVVGIFVAVIVKNL
ncbi:hypothetical protein SAMN06298226_0418 [Nitrosovibrio sp. Nv4]|nr:hypothetical protein SAMN06298226_0418 [Nitrosovibrio sp. Nv4]